MLMISSGSAPVTQLLYAVERKYLVEWNGMVLTGRNVNIWWSGMEWY